MRLLQFLFETGETSCPYWQEWVVVKSENPIDYDELKDSITSYMESNCGEESDFKDYVADIMDASGLSWSCFSGGVVINQIHTFWV